MQRPRLDQTQIVVRTMFNRRKPADQTEREKVRRKKTRKTMIVFPLCVAIDSAISGQQSAAAASLLRPVVSFVGETAGLESSR